MLVILSQFDKSAKERTAIFTRPTSLRVKFVTLWKIR